MKKAFSCIIVLLIAGGYLFCQPKVSMKGYGLIEWGSAPAAVGESFKDFELVDEREYTNSTGRIFKENIYRQKVSNSNVTERTFSFFNNELYRVDVRYTRLSQDDLSLLRTALEMLYGSFTITVNPRGGEIHSIKLEALDIEMILPNRANNITTVSYQDPVRSREIAPLKGSRIVEDFFNYFKDRIQL